jgi:hypothetical protein
MHEAHLAIESDFKPEGRSAVGCIWRGEILGWFLDIFMRLFSKAGEEGFSP